MRPIADLEPTEGRRASCERVLGRLDRYVDGVLPPVELARDEGHLEACAGCRAEEQGLRALLRSLSEAMAPDPAELQVALEGALARLSEEPEPRFRWRHLPGRVLVPLATAAAAVMLLLALQWTGSGFGAVTSVSSTELVPELDLRFPAWSDVVGELWTSDEAR